MKIMILGVGAQGSTVARRMDLEEKVTEIICADSDHTAVEELVKELKKARGVEIDARNKDSIIKAAEGVDLIVNALPLPFAPNVLEAALSVKANYQDFAATDVLTEKWEDGVQLMYDEYGKRFREIDRLAIIGTGSAPGLICVAARKAMNYLDTCETIYNIVYEGLEPERFLPFWWSPFTALSDMSEDAWAYVNGEIIRTTPFSLPITRKYDYMSEPVTCVEHAHDEPVYMGLNADKFFKGVKNAYFKYGGAGIDFAKPLYRAGLLSHEPEDVKGVMVAPFDVVLEHLPPAPKYHHEIQEIINEGLVNEEGCMVVEAIGMKDGKEITVEIHVYAPGLVEAFEKSGLTAEMYLTGQGGSLFTKLFVEGLYTQKGLISSDMLLQDQVDIYLSWAEALDITIEVRIIEGRY
ncbi:MAG: saccharopine dehydrogenase NADP-binding domain-containing protein [Anaerovoracaceae bacterium]